MASKSRPSSFSYWYTIPGVSLHDPTKSHSFVDTCQYKEEIFLNLHKNQRKTVSTVKHVQFPVLGSTLGS